MKSLIAGLACLLITSAAWGAIHAEIIEYKIGEKTFEGYIAWDDTFEGKRPGVIVIHEWWGNNAYPRRRAEEIAQLGYVGFAIDMFGKGNVTEDPAQAKAWVMSLLQQPQQVKARAQAALDVLKKHPQVDPERTAAIGYCFGGAIALSMARWNMDVDGVVTFHGDLSDPQPDQKRKIEARILVLTGDADAFVPQPQVESFKQEMARSGAECSVIVYPGAQHAFTNPDADKHHLESVKYDANADQASWDEMTRFFQELFRK